MINAILPSWPKKDYFNQRLSGLDVPLLKECTRNNIAIVFRFEDMLKVKKEERAIVVGKLSQNARLCMKFKTPYFICSGENKKDKYILTAFGNMLGLHGKKGVTYYPRELIGGDND